MRGTRGRARRPRANGAVAPSYSRRRGAYARQHQDPRAAWRADPRARGHRTARSFSAECVWLLERALVEREPSGGVDEDEIERLEAVYLETVDAHGAEA
jgi:hypothetical protein